MSLKVVDHTEGGAPNRLSKARYVSSEYAAREWTGIWQTQWLLAGLERDISTSGDFFVFEIGREQILVTRDTNHEVRAYFNVCQHRGNRLVTESRGAANQFRCKYHAWTYDLSGALRIVPQEQQFAAGVCREERALKSVHVDIWDGFVFVNLSPNPPSLRSFLGPVVEQLAPYRFRDMTFLEDQSVQLHCNWKAVIDNFSELYHVDFLHPQHKSMVDCANDTVHLFPNGHTGVHVPGATVNPRFPIPDAPTPRLAEQLRAVGLDPEDFAGRVADIRAAVQTAKRGTQAPVDYARFSDEQLSDVWQYNLFPNVIFSFTPEHVWLMQPKPHPSDPNRCIFDKLSFVAGANPPNERPARDVFLHEDVVAGRKSMTITIDQDIELLGGVQAGMLSSGIDDVLLSEDEVRVQHFHKFVDRCVPAS